MLAGAIRIGLISDTHGLLRPEALAFLAGANGIVHAGDVGGAAILERLAAIAPVTAVRGNNDVAPPESELPGSALLRVHQVRVYAVHDLADLDFEPRERGIGVVIHGHSHTPRIERRDAVWFVNPGSAGPRRFKLPIAVGELLISGSDVRPRIENLSVKNPKRA